MPLLFVYGSLKTGFANEHVNTGRQVGGRHVTLERFPLYLLGDGEVPCVLKAPGSGHQVAGELYEVSAADLAQMDKLERIGEPGGYERIEIQVTSAEPVEPVERRAAFVYVKDPLDIADDVPRRGPLLEYTQADAARFRWP